MASLSEAQVLAWEGRSLRHVTGVKRRQDDSAEERGSEAEMQELSGLSKPASESHGAGTGQEEGGGSTHAPL